MSTTPDNEDTQETRADREQAWEERRTRLRNEQNLPEGAVPEEREGQYERSHVDSAIVNKLREAGDPRGGQVPAMGFDAYERANSDSQKRKAAKASEGNLVFFNGQRGWIDNPGEPDHGRAVGINRVSEYMSEMDEVLDSVQRGRGKVKAYECTTRDGRSELLIVSAEHFRPCFNEAEWGKTPLMTPIP